MSANQQSPDNEPVTLIFSWKVTAGREHDFIDQMQAIVKKSVRWNGHLGVTFLRPPKGNGSYHSVLRFDNSMNLEEWLNSDARAAWLERLEGIASPSIIKQSGLETWFELPSTIAPPPPRWKMVIITFTAVFPFSLVLSAFVLPHLTHLPLIVRSLVFPILLPVLMIYVLIPFLTQRVFKRWLTNDK